MKTLKIKILKNNWYVLLEDYAFIFNSKKINIKKWFIFDWWSIPRFWWTLSHPLYQPYLVFFLEHDYLYSNKYKSGLEFDLLPEKERKQQLKKERNDIDKFLYIQIKLYNNIFANIVYYTVKIFWSKHFRKDIDKEELLKKWS